MQTLTINEYINTLKILFEIDVLKIKAISFNFAVFWLLICVFFQIG